jgi:hypothetical protein
MLRWLVRFWCVLACSSALLSLAACGGSNGGGTGSATLASITVTPSNPSISQGTTEPFTATGTFSDGSTQNLTSSATWNSSNTGAATIASTGVATAVTPGSTTIKATSGTVSGSTTLTVTSGTVSTASVLTYHNDLGRTGQNLNEMLLTPANVTSATFGKLFSDSIDGQAYAQPLYIPNLTISGQGAHNVVYVATENDTVYAFDADRGGAGSLLWHTSLLPNGGSAVSSGDTSCGQIVPQIGITSTPVIDLTSNTLYAVAMTKEGSSYFQRLHALDITTGQEKLGGPVVITATVPGSGAGSSGGKITFDPLSQLNRPGLALVNGIVYIAFGSHCDVFPYHGWMFAYSASNLGQIAVFNATPNGSQGAIWQTGDAPAVDSGNNLYVMTGNGTFDANTGGVNFGDSFLKLTKSGSSLGLSDYFTPFDQANLNSSDQDVGSGGPLVLPDQPGTHPHLLVGASKPGTIYLLNRDNMGHYCGGCSSDTQIVQSLPGAITSSFGTPAYWNGNVYFLGSGDSLKAFSLTNGLLSTSPTSQAVNGFGFPGATPSVSANGTTNGIVWALQNDAAGSGPAVLHAYNATNVATELYNSNQAAGGRDTPGFAVKFSVPTVVNGKVYIGTAAELDVFGLLP